MEEVKKRLVDEPLAEKAIVKDIAVLGVISDYVSKKVRAVRRESLSKVGKGRTFKNAKSISEICEKKNLKLYSENIKRVTTPDILIAGCGTGQHSLITASRFSECHVTAVDFSLASLAYAKRKQ